MPLPTLLSPDAIKTLRAQAASCPPGAFVEVGVYKGGSAWHLAEIAKQQRRKLYLYDTFSGVPFADDVHGAGAFTDCRAADVEKAIPDAVVIEGTFPESLIEMGPVAFVHADCDHYQSIKAVCLEMPRLMAPGGKILFDDFGCLDEATRAVRDHFRRFTITREGKALVTV